VTTDDEELAGMARFDATNSLCRIYVKRTGMLSAVGHDLEIGIEEYAIDIADSGRQVDATFATGSLRVIDAVEGGRLRPGTLSRQDKATIDRHMASDVLAVADYPTVEFHSDAVELRESGGYFVRGRLRLHGRERPLQFDVTGTGELVAEMALHQPDYGIRPFRAFAGALRIQPELRVRVTLAFTPAKP
jgi:YceI-like domain